MPSGSGRRVWSLRSLRDSSGSLPLESFARPDDRDEWEHRLADGPPTDFPISCFLLSSSAGNVLVDTGAGSAYADGMGGRLPGALAAAGLSLADIDVVVLTHAHFDHIGGAVVGGAPRFKHARHVLHAADWQWSAAEDERRSLLAALAAADQLELIDAETELLAGLVAIPAPGHTPGHLAVAAATADGELWVLGDLIAHPVQAQAPHLASAGDHDPDLACATRREVLRRVAAAGSSAAAAHLPGAGVGRVEAGPGGLRWLASPALSKGASGRARG